MPAHLPWTAKDIFKFSPKDWLAFNGRTAFYRLTGLWRYPIPTSGDVETMTRKDMIYWFYKAQFPIVRAARNSGLEAYFERQKPIQDALPVGFKTECELQVSAAGDLMDHPYLPNSADSLYSDVSNIVLGADLAMANLECVIFPQGTGAFTIRPGEAPPLYYEQANFDVAKGFRGRKYSFLSAACNHSLDCGEQGVATTISALKAEGIAFNGINSTENDSQSATILEKNGFKIGLISHTFGLNAKKPPQDKPWIVNRTHLNGKQSEVGYAQIDKQIQHCRRNTVDAIIAHLHWGLEHEYYPRPDQLEVAHHLAEMGVDLVIGHHPHVIQPAEFYRTQRDPNRIVPIYYSLGNLINPFSHPAFRVGGIARLTLSKGQTKEGASRTYVRSADLVRVFQEIDEKEKKLRLVPFAKEKRPLK